MDNGTTAEQTELRNLLFDLVQDELRRSNEINSQRDAFLPLLREVIYGYNENNRIYNENNRIYNENNRIYNENIRTTLQIVQNPYQPTNANGRNNRMRQQRPREQLYTNVFLPYLSYPTRDLSANRFQDVVVRPTQEQIQRATRSIIYNALTTTQTRCPITLEDFELGQAVRQITHCGHTFCESAIQNWFLTNVRCPVCRYDIRTNVQPQTQTQPSVTNNLMDSFTLNIANILQNYIDEEQE